MTTGRDARAVAVLRVLGGAPVDVVAAELAVEPDQLSRWVEQFVAGGSDRLAGRPSPDGAARIDRLLALVAHELRTPVGVLQGWTEVLECELGVAASAPRTREALRRLRRSGDRLRRLVDDLLDTAAASLGRYDLSGVTVDLADLCREVADDPAATVEAGSVVVHGEPAALRRIAVRLVAAARLGASSAPVVVRTVRVGIWGELAVTRLGRQLSLETIHELLDPLDVEDDRYVPSLGLHLVRALAIAPRGYVGARADEAGTTLYVRLPVPEVG
jgi:signal transduction histidine kinase